MEWIQVLTIVATMLAGVFAFFQITKQEIDIIREQINRMDSFHREDMKNMDEKWERLFERLLLQDKKQ